jgi:DNA invertase Pin-like site-specific DNA recombinase
MSNPLAWANFAMLSRCLGVGPGLAAMLDRIESNGVRVLIVERADRLARDLVVDEVILDQSRVQGCRVLAATAST